MMQETWISFPMLSRKLWMREKSAKKAKCSIQSKRCGGGGAKDDERVVTAKDDAEATWPAIERGPGVKAVVARPEAKAYVCVVEMGRIGNVDRIECMRSITRFVGRTVCLEP